VETGRSSIQGKKTVPALWRQRQSDLCEFKASVVHKASSKTTKAAHTQTLSQNKQTNKQTNNLPPPPKEFKARLSYIRPLLKQWPCVDPLLEKPTLTLLGVSL
jgi:glucose-6-phosphate 1-dehydrogenase